VSLQHPDALWLLGLLPLIVLLYILRSQRVQARVTTMRFWRQLSSDLEGRPARKLPLKEPLMWLQLLAVTGIALALTEPFIPQGERTHWIIVLDRSAATLVKVGDTTALESAKASIVQRIRSAGSGDTLSLVTVGGKADLVGFWSLSETEDPVAAVLSIVPFLGEVDPLAGLALASELARRTTDEKPIVSLYAGPRFGVIDGARLGTVPADVRVERMGSLADDVAIAMLTTRPIAAGRGRSSALVKVVNSGAQSRTVALRVTADGIALGARDVILGAESSTDAILSLPFGTLVVEAVVGAADQYALDDRAYALAAPLRQAEVRVVSSNPLFWERALSGIPGLKVTRVRPSVYRPADAALHLFDGYLPSDALIPHTPMLVVNPPAPPGSGVGPLGVGAANQPAVTAILRIDELSPLVRSADLIGLPVSTGGIREVPEWGNVVATTRLGPVLLAGSPGGLRTVVMAFDPGKAGLDRDVAFPVLVANAVAWLTGEPASDDVRIGEPRLYVPSPSAHQIIVRLPSGRAVAYDVRGKPIEIGDVVEPGAYSIVERDATTVIRTESLVANLPESQRGSAATADAAITGLVTSASAGSVGGQGTMWVILAAAALGLGLVEWLLYSLDIG
jgi:hypothetical protein